MARRAHGKRPGARGAQPGRDRHGAVAALASGDIDAITLSSLNLYGETRIAAAQAVLAISLAYGANLAFKLGVLVWQSPRLAAHAALPDEKKGSGTFFRKAALRKKVPDPFFA